MKTTSRIRITQFIAATIAASALTSTTSASNVTWETILPGQGFAPESSGSALLIDPFSDQSNPAVFVGTWGGAQGSLLHVDPNTPASAAVVDNNLERVYGLGWDGSTTLYAAGYRPRSARDSTPVWVVRRSVDRGQVWEDDADVYSPKGSGAAWGITTDAQKNVYVCGQANGTAGSANWVVRKLPAGSSTWTTVCNLKSKSDRTANDLCYFPGNALYAPAVLAVGIFNNKWTVMRSQNEGLTWETVDTWSPNNAVATAASAACDKDGNIYVVGYRATWLSPKGWVIRKSAHGGNTGTWTLELDASEGAASWATSVSADLVGNVWVGGMTQDANRVPFWTILQNSGEPWSESWNARQTPVPHWSKNRGIVTDSSGNHVIATGEVYTGGISYVGLQRLAR